MNRIKQNSESHEQFQLKFIIMKRGTEDHMNKYIPYILQFKYDRVMLIHK